MLFGSRWCRRQGSTHKLGGATNPAQSKTSTGRLFGPLLPIPALVIDWQYHASAWQWLQGGWVNLVPAGHTMPTT